MLQLYAVPQLPDGTIYQQDGAPPHFASIVRIFLDNSLQDGLEEDNITWPARTPDLTSPDFFLWEFVKDQVYRTTVRDLAGLQERIYAALNNVTPQILGSRLSTGSAFPKSLIEAMLRFMEHKVKQSQFSLFVVDSS